MKRFSAIALWPGFVCRVGLLGAVLAFGVRLHAQDSFEPDDIPASAQPIANGAAQTRSLHVGDVDWAVFVIGSGGATTLRIETAASTSAAGDTQLWLYDARDLTKELAFNDDAAGTRFSQVALTAIAPGTYYIKVTGDVGAYILRASWTDRPDALEADDTPAVARRILNGESQDRSIHLTTDIDWATFTIGSNGATNVRVETIGVAGDTEVWLYGPNSSTNQVAYNDDKLGGKFSLVTADSLGEGIYLVRVNAFGLGSTISHYALRVTWTERGDTFESDDTPAAAKTIANGQPQSRSIHVVGDVDWATFTVSGSGATNVRLETSSPLGDTDLALYGPDNPNALVAYNDDSGGGKSSLLTLNAIGPGTYFVKVGEFGNDGTIPGYTLRVSWTDAPPTAPGDRFEPDDTAPSGRLIANGESQPRSIHRDADVDWARFTVGPNGALNVAIETNGPSGDTEMWLYGPNDSTNELSYNDDGGNGKFATIRLNTLSEGTYYVKITSYRQASTVGSYILRTSWLDGTVSPATTRLANLSIRTNAGAGNQTVIVGFVLSGAGAKQLLVRAVGPTLSSFGLASVAVDPALQLFAATSLRSQNDNWGGDPAIGNAAQAVGAFALPAASRDAALLETFEAGSFSAQVSGGLGIALLELYDVTGGGLPRLSNLSARAQVGTGSDVLIAGFVVAGQASKTVLIRGIGPSLAAFGVAQPLADPRLDVFRGNVLIESNDNWNGAATLASAFTQVGAFGLAAGTRDAAILLTLQPGVYSAQVSGVAGTTGIALVEVYEVP